MGLVLVLVRDVRHGRSGGIDALSDSLLVVFGSGSGPNWPVTSSFMQACTARR